MNSYKDLIVWQKAIILCTDVYNVTGKFAKSEIFGLSSQMRRCAVSIPSNISEGYRRKTKDYVHFLRISYGSSSELDTQCIISKNVNYLNQEDYIKLTFQIEEVQKMLNKLINTLDPSL